MIQSSTIVNQFKEQGFVVIHNAIEAKKVASLRQFCLMLMKQLNSNLLQDVVIRYPLLRNVLDSPAILDALRQVLGNKLLVLPPSSVDRERFGFFHRDTTSAEMAGFNAHREDEWSAVVLGIYLQDNNKHGGGLTVVPGSHLRPDDFIEMLTKKQKIRSITDRSPIKRFIKRISGGVLFSWNNPLFENYPDQIDIPSLSGDVIFWDMRIIHRATPRRIKGESLPGGKLAVFYVIAKDNLHSRSWHTYWKEKVDDMTKLRPKGTVLPAPTESYEYL